MAGRTRTNRGAIGESERAGKVVAQAGVKVEEGAGGKEEEQLHKVTNCFTPPTNNSALTFQLLSFLFQNAPRVPTVRYLPAVAAI